MQTSKLHQTLLRRLQEKLVSNQSQPATCSNDKFRDITNRYGRINVFLNSNTEATRDKEIILAVLLYLRGKEAGVEISFRALAVMLNTELYRDYCPLAFPDICVCGDIKSETGNIFRFHCTVCKTEILNHWMAIDLRKFSSCMTITPSWASYGFAKAVQVLGKLPDINHKLFSW